MHLWNLQRLDPGEVGAQQKTPFSEPVVEKPSRRAGTFTGRLLRLLRWLFYLAVAYFAFECITVDLRWAEQAVIGCGSIILAIIANRLFRSQSATLALMIVSMLATGRYAYWRISGVVEAFRVHDRSTHWNNVVFVLLLLSAEIYAFVALYLGFFQTIHPLHRPPVPLPDDVDLWPHVDVMIPTYNEDLSVVRTTIFAALNIDYPLEKLHVYVLDDGSRKEFEEFCAATGAGYIIRHEHNHAKAGNLNHAMLETTSPYIAIFDADHIPTRSFLQVTVGWFLHDPKLGVMQTPHYFYSPDPFDRNLGQYQRVPNEGALFYDYVQDGNDFWNASFFCGSCAVLRRTAIEEIGGIATDTVTEDAHTSLRMQIRGWNSAYLNIPQAAGLATETLSRHVGQRIRWARGMAQILRTDDPLLARGLKLPQRICYFNAMLHYLYGGPRLLFATAPLVYLLLGLVNIPGDWPAILAYAMPHLVLANLTNHRTQGAYRHTGWNEVYETVLAPYIIMPTILALVNPKLGKFNVTSKGGVIEEAYFDRSIAWPYMVLIYLDLIALALVPVRYFVWNVHHEGAVIMNAIWALLGLVILGAANAVAREGQQVRKTVRIRLELPAKVELEDGTILPGNTIDLSLAGTMIRLDKATTIPPQARIKVSYPLDDHSVTISAQVVDCKGTTLRLQHDELTLKEEEQLTLAFYTLPDMWAKQSRNLEPDRPFESVKRLTRLSIRGIGYALAAIFPGKGERSRSAEAAVSLILLLAGLSSLHGQGTQDKLVSVQPQQSEARLIHSTFLLSDLGVPDAIAFRGVAASRNVSFTLPHTEVPQHAVLNLKYSFSPGLLPQVSHLNILLNGSMVTSLVVPQTGSTDLDALQATINLPDELLVRSNVLTFEFIGHYTMQCEDPSNTALWARVENSSRIDIYSMPFSLGDDLKILPLPFYDGGASSALASIPIVFTSRPSNHSLEAAGVITSWLGAIAKSRPMDFPVTIGPTLPTGNAILFVERPADMPQGVDVNQSGPIVAVRTNPADPYGKLLIIAGSNGDQVLTAARAIAIGNSLVQGRTLNVSDLQLPPPREADDAPLWMNTDKVMPFWNYTGDAELQSDGSGPVAVYLRTPPDLYYDARKNLPLQIDYRYNPISLANNSTLRVTANGSLVNEIALPHANDPRPTLSHSFAVPLVDTRPFSNTFLFNFYFQIAKTGNCQDMPPINLQGAILRSSYLDLRGIYHWAPMPNLELFANAGFPFTRFADLSQTRIVLPSNVTEQEVSLYLALMAYFGEQTGLPAFRVQVGDPANLGNDEDYLIIGNANDQVAFDKIANELPVAVRGNGLTIHDTTGLFSLIERQWWRVSEVRPDWWWRLGQYRERQGLMASLSDPPDVLLQGIQSPWGSARSIVTITLKNDDAVKPFLESFWKSSSSGDISQSVSVLHGRTFTSYRLGEKYYYVGHLPWWLLFRFWMHTYPFLIVMIGIIIALLMVPFLQASLKRRARRRLAMESLETRNV